MSDDIYCPWHGAGIASEAGEFLCLGGRSNIAECMICINRAEK